MTPPLPHPALSLALVLPCFNEARRLPAGVLRIWLDRLPHLQLVLVDDGSSDDTPTIIRELAAHDRVHGIFLPHNQGKAEAVRRGMLRASELDVEAFGFWDADLAAPLHHLPLMLDAMSSAGADACLGVRPIQTTGRTQARAIFGRSGRWLLRNRHTPDPQCGAKLFMVAPQRTAALSAPMQHRWLFDLELMDRLDLRAPVLHELPDWRDVPDSRLRGRQWAVLLSELARLHLQRIFPQVVRKKPQSPLGPTEVLPDESC